MCLYTGAAQLALDEMEAQRSKLENEVKEMRESCDKKQQEINDINQQIVLQEKTVKV